MQIYYFLQSATTTTSFKLIERDARVENGKMALYDFIACAVHLRTYW